MRMGCTNTCELMRSVRGRECLQTPVTETLLGEAQKLFEIVFSALRRLNFLYCHKFILDALNTVDIAKKFVWANKQRKRHFGKYE